MPRASTESDSQRASNHNCPAFASFASALKAIVKEHQITTAARRDERRPLLKAIVKEHQITTLAPLFTLGITLKAIVKEHQITTMLGSRV